MGREFRWGIGFARASADRFRRSLRRRRVRFAFLGHLAPGGGKWAPRGRVALPGFGSPYRLLGVFWRFFGAVTRKASCRPWSRSGGGPENVSGRIHELRRYNRIVRRMLRGKFGNFGGTWWVRGMGRPRGDFKGRRWRATGWMRTGSRMAPGEIVGGRCGILMNIRGAGDKVAAREDSAGS